jgi:hypothetical protein
MIGQQQEIMLQILDEIKRAGDVKPETRPPGKWHFKIIKDEKGMTDVIATEE